MYRIIILILGFVGVHSAYSQDFKSDMSKLYSYYIEADSLKMQMHVNIYATKGSNTPTMRKTALVSKKDSKYYYSIDDTEMLMNDKSLLMVDNSQKKIIYRSLSVAEAEAMGNKLSTFSLDSTLHYSDSVVYIGEMDGIKKYAIYTLKNLIKKTEISLYKASGAIESIVYYYNPNVSKGTYKVTIEFNNKVIPVNFAQEFSESNYIVRRKNAIIPTGKYKEYDLSTVDYED